MVDSSTDVAIPTVIVYPTAFKLDDIIYNYAELYHYSSIYSVDLKRVREGKKEGAISKYVLYTDSDARKKMECEIECTKDIGLVKLPSTANFPARLPVRNISKAYPNYNYIINAFVHNIKSSCSEEEINAIFTSVKKNQTYDYNGIKLFKDFIKQKPLSLDVYCNFENDPEHCIMDVCLKMDFNTKLTHLVFYRYVKGVVENIIGSIEEVRQDNGK
jgi:hypothetical protein